ncbi:MAG TPA: PAS domain S-box protein, partial [bacterium]|nr:PAS domain S-box protein [bacterium]
MIYLDLVLNLTLLVALSVISGFVDKRWPRHTRLGVLMQGSLFGVTSVIGMLKPLVVGPGLIFDGRSVLLSLCALFFGPWAAVTAAPMPIACRIWMGGSGSRMGVLVVLSSVAIGLWAHSRLRPHERPISSRSLYLFGWAVHLAMVAMMFTLPPEMIFQVMFRIGPPVLLLYPLATLLAGKILADQLETQRLIRQLHESQEFTKTILDNLPIGVAVNSLHPEVVFTYMNDNFPRFYRTSRETLAHPDAFWSAVYEDPDFREQLRKRVLEDCSSNDPQRMEWVDIPITRAGSETTYITARDIPVPGKSLVISAVWDVTDRRMAELALRESESRFRLFAELAPVGIVISDVQENTLYVSQKFVEMFGYTMEDMPSVEHWWPLAYPDEKLRNQVRAHWKQALEYARATRSEIAPVEFPVTCKDGTVREIEFRMSNSGDLNFVLFTDITERRRTERETEQLQSQLLQAQKMESVGRLAGGVAHDFNNMLMVIAGHTQMALEHLNPQDAVYADLVEVQKAASRSTDLTRQLLAFARKQAIAPRVLDLNETVEGMLKVLR